MPLKVKLKPFKKMKPGKIKVKPLPKKMKVKVKKKVHEEPKQADDLACLLHNGARLKIIGLGGIGCIVLDFVGRYLKSQQHIHDMRLVLIDGDEFEPSNDRRMCFTTLGNKAEVKADEAAKSLAPFETVIAPVAQYVNADNIKDLIKDGDHVFLCVDNHPTRRLVDEHCQTLKEVVLFSGGNEGIDPPKERGVYGNVQIHVRKDGKDVTIPIGKYHPEIAQAEGDLPGGPNCGELALSTPQILFANLAVASAMCSAFFAYATGNLRYQEVKLDILENRLLPQLQLPKDSIVPQMGK